MSGKRTSLKDPDLQENLYVYDNAGRLSKEQIAASQTAYYTYDGSGLVTRRDMPGNVVIAYMTYDAKSGRLSELKQHQGAALGLQTKSYVRNENGAIVRVDTNGSLDYFSYDALDRLVHDAEPLAGPDGTNNYYTYDAASNRVRKDSRLSTLETATYYTYDARNLLTREHLWDPPSTATTTYYDFDAAQRMTRQRSSAVASYFAFDQRDQIARLQNVSGSPDPIQYFSYSGLGERVRIADGDGEAYWSFDGSKLLREKAPGGTVVARYRHNVNALSVDENSDECPEPRLFEFVPGGTGSPTARSSLFQATFTPEGGGGPVTAVPRYDERGSITRMISVAGDVVESYSYDRFGVTQATGGKQRHQFMPRSANLALLGVWNDAHLQRGTLRLPRQAISLSLHGAGPGAGLGEVQDTITCPCPWTEEQLRAEGRGDLTVGLLSSTRGIATEVGIAYPPKSRVSDCCDQIGFIQIVSVMYYHPLAIGWVKSNLPLPIPLPGSSVASWSLDWIPGGQSKPWYPFQTTWKRNGARPFASLTDKPGFDSNWRAPLFWGLSVGMPSMLVRQEFETCAICITSTRGPAALDGGILSCAKWGQAVSETGPLFRHVEEEEVYAIDPATGQFPMLTWPRVPAPVFLPPLVGTGAKAPTNDFLAIARSQTAGGVWGDFFIGSRGSQSRMHPGPGAY